MHYGRTRRLLCQQTALQGCPLSPAPLLFAARSPGVDLHPGCGGCWWEQDHEQALCGIPAKTLHWETGFSDIITFWDLSISQFLSLLIRVCIALCTEMVIFFNRMWCFIKWNSVQCRDWQCCYFYQSNCISKKKQYQVQQKCHSAFICLCIQKSNQSAKLQQIRKYIQLFKFSKKKKIFVHPFCSIPENRKVFTPSWYSATPITSETANFTLKPFKADGL